MLLQHTYFLHFCVFFLIAPLAFSSNEISITKPGCPTRCGNLTIPFPFGIGSGCYEDPYFEIHCDTSTNPPTAYLQNIPGSDPIQVTNISYSESQIRVKLSYLSTSCENGMVSPANINFSSTPYTLSAENCVTSIGCDDFMTIQGITNKSFGGGCLSYCSDRNGIGSCPGVVDDFFPRNGCCQIPIPKGTISLETNISDMHKNWRENKLFPCSYAFIAEMGKGYGYRMNNLNNKTAFLDDNPEARNTTLALDWRIGTQNCRNAESTNATAFLCHNNSVCNDTVAGGYTCGCSKGYEGNPYVSPGCQDINECQSESTNPCTSICINQPGSYQCICRKGYYGDGRRDGFGCRRLPPSELIKVIKGLGAGFGSLLLLSICFCFYKLFRKRAIKKQKEKFFKRNGGLVLHQQTNEGTIRKTKLFTAKELDIATDHFNKSRILGQGGQGTVYKGMLPDGQIVAIKKSRQVHEKDLEQFINEVVVLSQINHRNVVKLLGCCLETEVPLLVYEFVPNGTLSDLIHDPNNEFPVTWSMRLKIASDVAGALAYLHSASSCPIYHRDIKSSNILLDEKYVVKVSDFGTSKWVAVDQTHVTTVVKGTFGYLDPEYFQSHHFTEKSDVYSFGVVIVELLTGRRPVPSQWTEEERGLVARFIESMERDCLNEILDEQVLGEAKKEEVVAVARLARQCLNLKGRMRPTMKEVATELESVRMSHMPRAADDGLQQATFLEATPQMPSDFEYSWTTSGKSITSSSSNSRPLMINTV